MVFEKDLLNGGNKNSTRSHSFLFIAFGICVISNLQELSELQIQKYTHFTISVYIFD